MFTVFCLYFVLRFHLLFFPALGLTAIWPTFSVVVGVAVVGLCELSNNITWWYVAILGNAMGYWVAPILYCVLPRGRCDRLDENAMENAVPRRFDAGSELIGYVSAPEVIRCCMEHVGVFA